MEQPALPRRRRFVLGWYLAERRRYPAAKADIECLLPLSLQDLSLLVVISALDWYPVELLASLPLWMRRRLLNNLPVLDLCRLDETPIAKGVDLTQMWDSRCQGVIAVPLSVRHRRKFNSELSPDFQVKVYKSEETTNRFHRLHQIPSTFANQTPLFEEELKSAFQSLQEGDCPKQTASRVKYLSNIVSDVLTSLEDSPTSISLNVAARKLISVPGKLLLSNLTSCNAPITLQNCYSVWKKQTTALVLEETVTRTSVPLCGRRRLTRIGNKEVSLTPDRLRPIRDSLSALKLLSLLSNNCNVRPSSIWIHVEALSSSILRAIHSEKLAFDSGLNCNMTCTSAMTQLLTETVILRVQCDKYSNIGVMVRIIECAKSCQLKHVFCTMPDLFIDTVQPFLGLFSLSNFYQLDIELGDVHLLSLSKLIRGFLMTHCSQAQQLIVHTEGKLLSPAMTFDDSQIAALDLGKATVPQCAIQHKMIKFSSKIHFTQYLLPLLLQMPVIRLNEINFVSHDVHHHYLHLCALHPDLLVAKLGIYLTPIAKVHPKLLLHSIQEDFASLFKMHTLLELTINIHRDWSHIKEVQVALTEALRQRSHLYPLRKISLDIAATGYDKGDFYELWDTILSLPYPEQLEIILGKELTDLARKFMNEIYEGSVQVPVNKQLKSIVLTAHELSEEDVIILSVARSYSLQCEKKYVIQ